jgi:hypothetical protein
MPWPDLCYLHRDQADEDARWWLSTLLPTASIIGSIRIPIHNRTNDNSNPNPSHNKLSQFVMFFNNLNLTTTGSGGNFVDLSSAPSTHFLTPLFPFLVSSLYVDHVADHSLLAGWNLPRHD